MGRAPNRVLAAAALFAAGRGAMAEIAGAMVVVEYKGGECVVASLGNGDGEWYTWVAPEGRADVLRGHRVPAMPELWGLLVLSLGMTLVPGIDTAMVLRVSLSDGRRAGVLTAAGCATGLFVHAAAVAVGVAALVAASATAYQALKIAGAVFLIVLGLLTLRNAGRATHAPKHEPSRHPFALGLLTNLGNPKALLFFLSVLPQFLSGSDAAALPTALAVAVIPVACSLGGLSLWAIATGGLGDLLRRPRARRIQERIMGTVLVALGLRVALER